MPPDESDTAKELPQHELVVKSNDFIRAKTDWTTVEHRITLKLIAQLRKEDKEFSYQTIRIKDIIELSGSRSNDLYSRAEEICEKLLDQKIRIKEKTPTGERKYKGFNLMSACEYVEGSGRIRAKFNPDMRPFLLELKRRFTMFKLQFVMRLSSPYAIRFYEIIKMREDLRFVRVSIDELREILCVEHKYTRFTDLKKYVIEPSRQEIKAKCDVYFTYRVERKGRTPVAVNIMIHPNEDVEPPVIPEIMQRLEGADDDAAARQEAPSAQVVGLFIDEDEPEPLQLNARVLFLQDLSQDELATLTDTQIDQLYAKAEKQASKDNPDSGNAVRVMETFRRMKRIWKDEMATMQPMQKV